MFWPAFPPATKANVFEALKAEVKREGWFEPKVVYGYFQCQADGNDVVVYDPEKPAQELLRINFPRQREGRRLAISDFFEPIGSDRMDVIGFSVVTIGSRASEVTKQLFDNAARTGGR